MGSTTTLDHSSLSRLDRAMWAWNLRRSNPEEAYRSALSVLREAKEHNDSHTIAWTMLTCSAYRIYKGNPESTTKALNLAQTLFEQCTDPHGKALTKILHAYSLFVTGNYNAAITTYKLFLDSPEKNSINQEELFETYNGLAGCYWALDEVEPTMGALAMAFAAAKSTGNLANQATVLSNFGAALLRIGSYEAALDFLILAKRLADQASYTTLQLNLLTNLAHCYYELSENKQALQCIDILLRTYRTQAGTSIEISHLCVAAEVYARAGRWLIVEELLSEIRVIVNQNPRSISLLSSKLTEARIAAMKEQYQAAILHAEEALKIAGDNCPRDLEYHLLKLLIDCYIQTDKPSALNEFLSKFSNIKDKREESSQISVLSTLDLRRSLCNAC